MGEKAASKIATSEVEQAQALILTNQNLEEANQKLAEQLEIQTKVADAMGLSGVVLKGINKALGGVLGDTGGLLKNSEERIKLLVEEKQNGQTEIYTHGV